MKAIGIRVYGKVQGVFYRASTKSKAEDIGVFGWVKNDQDGTVLIHAEGEESKLQQLRDWCRQGPEFARVSDVQSWDEAVEGIREFEIRRS